MKSFGERLKEQRELRSLSLREVAALTGTSHGIIQQMEMGKLHNPTIRTFWRLCQAYDIGMSDVYRLLEIAGEEHDQEGERDA